MSDIKSDNVAASVQQLMQIARVPDYKIVYANHMRLRINPAEIGITFGFIDEVVPGVQIAQESVSVVMSPSTARSLANILYALMDEFEATYGAIPKAPIEPMDSGKINEILQREMERPKA